jgi:omega-6 fatty acid desaturase (delta-12 desaturase)
LTTNGTSIPQDIDSRDLVRVFRAYGDPAPGRSLFELAITLVPFLALYAAMLAGVQAGYLTALILVIPAGALLLRLFLIQHDCGHGSFLRSRFANDWLGRCLGVLTLTPYDCWRRSHALHHASTGNLDSRGFGDVDTLTVREFQTRSRSRQLLYRAYRHPLVLFGLGPAYLFLLRHRLPIGLMSEGRRYWTSALATNAGIAIVAGVAISATSLTSFLLVQLPVTLLAASAGVWLFYVQHQFEHTHWDRAAHWSFHEAALRGSSHLALPGILRWFTANIGVHHVHHLASRIPFYRLPEVLRDHPQLAEVNRIGLRQTIGAFRMALWDEDQRKLVCFEKAQGGRSGPAAFMMGWVRNLGRDVDMCFGSPFRPSDRPAGTAL